MFFAFLFLSCQEKQPPNILIILADDQGWGDIGLHGNPQVQTPYLDRLAREGARFDRFFVQPVCSPTRAELLTGRYAQRGGVYDTSEGGERLDLDEKTLAEYFRQAGYATAAYGKWHSGAQYPYHPNGRGFDDYYGFCSGHWGDYFSPMLEHNGELVTGNGFLTDDLTDRALSFMEQQREKGQPFLLYLPLNTPHSPMQVPNELWARFANQPLDSLATNPEQEDPDFTRAALALTENIDWNIGRILQKMNELQLDDNTIVLYFSDNGPNSWRWNGGMKGRKGSTDEGGVRSPLFIRWKGQIAEGKQVPQIASVLDLLPTLADLAGIPFAPPKPLDGQSLKPLLLEANPAWPDRLLVNHWAGKTSVRSQRFRLDADGQLFDMQQDPGQKQHVAEQFPAVWQQLADAKAAWEKDALAELPAEDTRTFPIGHPQAKYDQLPARDGQAVGGIQRSNRFPNCSFFTNWTSLEDQIRWEVDVVESGDFEVVIYYTCPIESIGSRVQLASGTDTLTFRIAEAHDPPLRGMEYDRVPRSESYVKDFKPLSIGKIRLEKGATTLVLQAAQIPGPTVMDFRLLLLKRV